MVWLCSFYFQDRLLSLLFPHPAGAKGIPLDDTKCPESPNPPTGAPVLPPVLQAVVQGVGPQPAEPQGSGKAETRPGSIPMPTITWSTFRYSAASWPRVQPRLPGNGRGWGRWQGGNQQQQWDQKLPITELEKIWELFTVTQYCPHTAQSLPVTTIPNKRVTTLMKRKVDSNHQRKLRKLQPLKGSVEAWS